MKTLRLLGTGLAAAFTAVAQAQTPHPEAPAVPATPVPAAAPATTTRTAETEDFLLFNFEQVDIRLFTQVVGGFIGRRFVVAEDVAGKITVVSPKVSRESAYPLFVGVLAQVSEMVEPAGLQIEILRLDFRQRRLGHDLLGNVLDA